MKIGKINIYDYIGSGGITAKDISDLLDNFEKEHVEVVEVHINSFGGEIFEGFAIFNLLREKDNVSIFIDGIAASISSVIALSGNKVNIYKNAYLMVHNPWNISIGDTNDHKKNADDLAKFRDTLIDMYKSKTGMSEEDLKEMLDRQTFLNADEALEYGFVDNVINNLPAKNYVALYSDVIDNPSKNNNEDIMLNKILKTFGFTDEEILTVAADEGDNADKVINRISEHVTNQQIEKSGEDPDNDLEIENADPDPVDSLLLAKLDGISQQLANICALPDLVAPLSEKVNSLSDKFDFKEFYDSLEEKVEKGEMTPALKSAVVEIFDFIKDSKFDELSKEDFNASLSVLFGDFVEKLPKTDLFAKLDNTDQYGSEKNDLSKKFSGLSLDKSQVSLYNQVSSYSKTNNIPFSDALKIIINKN